ncbi:M23 family metallopeptidase [Bacillus sp. OAE603]|uniref:murein hydrolase activator EnvC family protein n=1 Tax=Gottfriedia sp. OAE603 TaxID=2663872 RepID=UPI00178B6043
MKENKKSKVMIMVLSSTFIIGAIPSVSFAESKYQTQIDSIEKKRSEVKEKSEATKDKIDDLQQDQANVVKKLEQLDVKMKETKRQVNQTQDAVESGKKEISKLKEEIKFIEKRIESRQELLKDRMRSLQKSGGMLSYIDVILGSNSFGDLIQRMSAVQVIMEADEDIIKQQNLDLKIVNSKKDEMTVKQAKIERDLANLESLNKQLSNQVNEQNNLMASLKEQEKEAHEDVLNLKEQDELLASQQIALKKAAEEAKRKAAEEARLKVEREKEKNDNKPSNGGSGNSGNSGNSGGGSTPPISSGNFTRPAAGYISSGFGNRSFDGGGFHDGVDIAGSGTVPVVSAGDGVVIRAYTSSSYGNCVFITHNIDGQVWTTVYAHLDSFNVSTGQSVSKGTKIGFMGNTGHSFGQHLHFELHKGEWNASKSNAVDPQKYINF